MSVLEDRYRGVLRLLPASYREVWEEDMVATFLESRDTADPDEAEYDADFGRPGLSEVLSIVALALRLRLGGVGSPPRSFLWGEAVRRVALLSLLGAAVMIPTDVLGFLWLEGAIAWLPLPFDAPGPPVGPAASMWGLVFEVSALLWVGAYLALVLGRWDAAKPLAILALVALVVARTHSALEVAADGASMHWAPLAGVVSSALVVVALAAFHADAPPVRRRPWLVAFGAGLVASFLLQVALLRQAVGLSGAQVLDWAGIWCVVSVITGLVYLGGKAWRRPDHEPSWPLALLLTAQLALIERLVSLADDMRFGMFAEPTTFTRVALVEAIAVVAVLVPLAVLAARELRRHPHRPVKAPLSAASLGPDMEWGPPSYGGGGATS